MTDHTVTEVPVMTLGVASVMFDDVEVNLMALLELRTAGWSVEIEHSGAWPDWGLDPAVWFYCRKLFPDNSPGLSPDDKLINDVCNWIEAFSEKWGGFFDHADLFKNPKAKDWKYHPWNDFSDDSDFWKNYDRE
jgi:hypothetical protein